MSSPEEATIDRRPSWRKMPGRGETVMWLLSVPVSMGLIYCAISSLPSETKKLEALRNPPTPTSVPRTPNVPATVTGPNPLFPFPTPQEIKINSDK